MEENIKEWLWSVAAKKMIMRLVIVIVAWISTLAVEKAGITIDQAHFQAFLFGAIYGGMEMFRNWVKLKTGWSWL